MTHERLYNTAEAARIIDTTPRYLEKLRNTGRGPAHIRLGPKAIRYRKEDLDAYRATSSHDHLSLTLEQAAAHLGISEYEVTVMSRRPDGLRARTLNGATEFDMRDIDAFIERCRVA